MCFPALLAVGAAEGVAAGTALAAGAATAGSGFALAASDAAFTSALAGGAGGAATGGMFGGMSGMQVLSMAGSGLGQLMNSQSQQDQANYSAQVAKNNATTAQYQADDARRRAELDAEAIQRRTSGMVGQQRAGYAAKGLDISDGTPGDVIDQTNFFGNIDAGTARYNGKVDAWGKTVQSQNFSSSANAATYNGGMASAGSLLGGAGAVADKWYQYSKTTTPEVPVDPRAQIRGQRGY